MLIKELKLPFPIYASRKRQHRFRKNCSGQIVEGLISPNASLLPFQFRIEGAVAPTITSIELFNACDPSLVDEVITDELGVPLTDGLGNVITTGDLIGTPVYDLVTIIGGIDIIELNGGFNIIYNGGPLSASLACGYYEMKISLNGGALDYWSEVFRVVEYPSGLMPFLKMIWSNPENLETIVYSNGFENHLYLDSFISHSDPITSEDIEKDGIESEQVVFAKQIDRYIFSEIVPDYLKTAIVAATVHRTISVFDPETDVLLEATRLRTTTQAEGSGCFSFVELTIEIENELFRTACQ